VQARLRSESTVSPLSPTFSRPAVWLGFGLRGRLTLVLYARAVLLWLRFRKDRQARRQGRPPVPRRRPRRSQRPLHHHRLHGACLPPPSSPFSITISCCCCSVGFNTGFYARFFLSDTVPKLGARPVTLRLTSCLAWI
jgi:hypothetical protein